MRTPFDASTLGLFTTIRDISKTRGHSNADLLRARQSADDAILGYDAIRQLRGRRLTKLRIVRRHAKRTRRHVVQVA